MSWEQPEVRPGRTAVILLVAAIFVATALAIALVAGAASQSSKSSKDVLVLGARVTHDTSKARGGTHRGTSATTTRRDGADGSISSSSTSSTSTSSTTSTTAVPGTSDVAAAPPASELAPAGRYPDAPIVASATISVPEIQLDAPVYEGVSSTVLDVGPGHWPGTAAPGGYGNLVIAGHRSTSSRPFERIGELAPGDAIVVSDSTGAYTYAVEGSDVVEHDRLVVDQTAGYTLTLVAPHPPGSDRYRYVVRARLVSAPRPPGV